jgi:hypothetical protein
MARFAMTQAELRCGHNDQARSIAQEIIVILQQEIVAMRLPLGQPLRHPRVTYVRDDEALFWFAIRALE